MKKVLLISYYWPPAGGPGSIRMVKFAHYLPKFGWKPIILTVQRGEFPYRDPSLEKDLPDGIPVFRSKSWDPFIIYKMLTGKKQDESLPVGLLTRQDEGIVEKIAAKIRTNFFIPDARLGWVPFAVKMAKKIICRENIDTIMVSSPPHSSQLIGLILKRKTGIPWLADLRDPWTDIRYYEFSGRMKISEKIDSFFEKKVLQKADAITTVSNKLASSFAQKAKIYKEKINILYNGFDAFEYENIKVEEEEKFTILYVGNLLENQNPEVLWRVAVKLLQENVISDRSFQIKFIGQVHSKIRNEINKMDLQKLVSFHSFRPHSEIISEIKKVSLLLMVIPRVRNNLGIVTSKLFEYLGSHRPILVIGPPASDAGKIISNVQGSHIVDYEDEKSLENYLKYAIQLWSSQAFYFDNRSYIHQFSREELTEKLSNILYNISS